MLLVLPFENASKAPGLDWIGEAFAEVLGQRMASPWLYVVPREDRTYAFDRDGIPLNVRPSHATLFRIAEQMDADYIVLGHYAFDGQTFTATAELLDVKRLKLSPDITESGPLNSLIEIQTALAWDLLRLIRPDYSTTRNEFLAGSPPIRLDAFENYIRGITASTREEKIKRLRQAVRLNPSYTAAILQLGRVYFAGRDYEAAASWLSQVPHTSPLAREASFYAGLSYFYLGNFQRANDAFSYLASVFPLTQVYNNLGVVAARRGQKNAAEFFHKAVEADPNDPDYHFNLALALYRMGDLTGATKQARQALALSPEDAEIKSLLDIVSGKNINSRPRLPLERIKRNYDETSFRQLALEIQNTMEARLSKTDPRTHAAYYVEHGYTMLDQKFIVEAGQEFRQAIRLDPASAKAHAGLAAVLETSNDPAGALKEANTALKLQPTAEAYVVLARLNLRENNSVAAEANLKRALALEPANKAALQLKRTMAAKAAGGSPAQQ